MPTFKSRTKSKPKYTRPSRRDGRSSQPSNTKRFMLLAGIPLVALIGGGFAMTHYMGIETISDDYCFDRSDQHQLAIFIDNSTGNNLSAQQFSEDNFIDRIKFLVGLYEVDPKYIDWEITESILLEDLSQVGDILQQLKDMGSSISIDDFGTGCSSLQYLQKLPVDTLKIDRSFIVELAENPTEESLVSGIIFLAHNLQLNVVAEGVEDKAMVEYLSERNCDFIQGYYYYKPMNQQDMTRVFEQNR